jgi:septum formation protein
LLNRFGLPFEVMSPGVDETAAPGEAPRALSLRLAVAKAQAVAVSLKTANTAGAANTAAAAGAEAPRLIIGSDQVAYIDTQVFGKPGTLENAVAQLRAMRGRELLFDTALCVLNSLSGHVQSEVVTTTVRMRSLTDLEIERYLAREPALDCAGSAKSEALGITLMESIHCHDPTALVGLPLIALSRMLRTEGVALP